MALSLLSTAAMVRLGRVREGRMIDLRATNAKLRLRALRMVEELGGVTAPRARAALEASGWSVRRALERVEGAGARSNSRSRGAK
jgi:N-acetylmuramic acid 6-phosphate etherase